MFLFLRTVVSDNYPPFLWLFHFVPKIFLSPKHVILMKLYPKEQNLVTNILELIWSPLRDP